MRDTDIEKLISLKLADIQPVLKMLEDFKILKKKDVEQQICYFVHFPDFFDAARYRLHRMTRPAEGAVHNNMQCQGCKKLFTVEVLSALPDHCLVTSARGVLSYKCNVESCGKGLSSYKNLNELHDGSSTKVFVFRFWCLLQLTSYIAAFIRR